MGRFLLHFSVFLVVFAAVAAATFLPDLGYADAYYYRVSGPPARNLILGTSKAGQGIRPDVLEAELERPFRNFAFSLTVSPYGPTYARRIREKLDHDGDGVAILAVDPWSVAAADPRVLPEGDALLGTLPSVTARPNVPYLWHYFERPYLNILLRQSPARLHRDGWLEVHLAADDGSVARRTAFTLQSYRERSAAWAVSPARIESLDRTISELRESCHVVVVRLPVSPELMEVEEALMPDFDARINQLLAAYPEVGYLNLTPDNARYRYHDGVHLTPESAAEVTRRIAARIRSSAGRRAE